MKFFVVLMLIASVLTAKLHTIVQTKVFEPCYYDRPTSCPKGVNQPVCGRKVGKRSTYTSACEACLDETVNSYATGAC